MTHGARPSVFARGLISLERSTAVLADVGQPGTGAEFSGVAYGGYTITGTDGFHYGFTFAPDTAVRYYDLDPGILALALSPSGAFAARYDAGAMTPSWLGPIGPADLVELRVAGWLADGDVAVAAVAAERQEITVIHVADGTQPSRAMIPRGPIAVAPRGGTLALLVEERARCETCMDLEVRELVGGRRLRRVPFLWVDGGGFVPLDDDRDPYGSVTFGFDGTLAWAYSYGEAHHNDASPWSAYSKDTCSYEVFDAVRGGSPIRTSERLAGEWGALVKACLVRALLPTTDGGALAVVVHDSATAEVVKFATPP